MAIQKVLVHDDTSNFYKVPFPAEVFRVFPQNFGAHIISHVQSIIKHPMHNF